MAKKANGKKIKNRDAYFSKILWNMARKEKGKAIDIDNFEDFTDKPEDICQSVEDEYFCGNLLDWIELVESADLHKALKSLSEEEQTLLGYLYFKDKTQTEVAKIYGIAQQNINKKLQKVFKKIKKFLASK